MFIRISREKLTPLQKRLLVEARRHEGSGLTITALARTVSAELGIPLSTAKWNLRRLRDLGLIDGGSRRARRPYSLSPAGRLLADELLRSSDADAPGWEVSGGKKGGGPGRTGPSALRGRG